MGGRVAEQLRQGLHEVALDEDMLFSTCCGPKVVAGQRLCEARGQRDLPQLPLQARLCSTALRRSF